MRRAANAALPALPTLKDHFLFRGLMEKSPRTVLPFHERIFEAVSRWALGALPSGARHLAVTVPPRHGKTIIAHDAVCWLTGLFPDSHWIYASYAAELAVAQTMRIRAVMSSRWYRRVYPQAAVREGSGRRNHFENVSGGLVYGVGAQGPITGFGAGRKRPGFGGAIVIDDPIKPGEARSAAVRAGVNKWFTETLLSRRNTEDTPILIIMQRLHPEDLVGHVASAMPSLWRVLSVPAYDEASGETLWPATFSASDAALLREVDPGAFHAQYQQSPVPPGGNIIKLSWWRVFDAAEIPARRGGLIFLTADTAYKSKKDSDASVIRAWEGTREHLYCLDAVYGRWEFPRLLQEARDFWQKWAQKGAREFWVEDKASGTPLAQTLRDNNIPASDWKPSDFDFPDDKVGRMHEAAWTVHGGKVLLPAGGAALSVGEGGQTLHLEPHAKVLAEECAAFNADMSHAHDDHCDTLTMAISLWRQAGGGL